MKYALVLLLLLSGCTDNRGPYGLNPMVTPYREDLGRSHECNIVAGLGYKVDMDACIKHINYPKFKRGSIQKVTSDKYDKACVFKIFRPIWSHGLIMNKPAYSGTMTCPAGDNFSDSIMESEL